MTRHPRAYATAAIAAALLATSGCTGASYGTGSSGTECTIAAKINVEKGRIVASATATCAPAPRLHHMTIELQNRLGGANTTFGQIADPATSTEIPDPSTTLPIALVCLPGTWRLKAEVTGISATGQPFSGTFYSRTLPVSLDDCKRR